MQGPTAFGPTAFSYLERAGILDHETVRGVSRFAISAKRLGAVSAAARERASALPRACEFAARSAARVARARLSTHGQAAILRRAAGELKMRVNQRIGNMNSKNKPNGHGAVLAKSSGANGTTTSLSGIGRAASVDASELSVANAATSSVAAGADREAYADVAPSRGKGKRPQTAGAASRSRGKKSGKKKRKEAGKADARRVVLPALEPLPVDGEAFVDAVHAQVDLVQLEVDLLSSKDDKIVQRELAYLRELRYGKRAAAADEEPTQIIFDMPGPERDKQ